MSLAGWAITRILAGSAFTGLLVIALFSQLPGFPPPVVAEAPPLEKTDRIKDPAAVAPPTPTRAIRTIPIYTPPVAEFLPTPAPVASAPLPAPEPVPVPSRPSALSLPSPVKVAPAKPVDRFSRFCRGRGPRSWMRFGGRKRYCK